MQLCFSEGCRPCRWVLVHRAARAASSLHGVGISDHLLVGVPVRFRRRASFTDCQDTYTMCSHGVKAQSSAVRQWHKNVHRLVMRLAEQRDGGGDCRYAIPRRLTGT